MSRWLAGLTWFDALTMSLMIFTLFCAYCIVATAIEHVSRKVGGGR